MEAVILHAGGDEILAEGIAAKIAPADSFAASLRADAGLTFGDQLAIFVIWSAKAAADGLGSALTRVAARAQGRCIVVRADGAPLPELAAAAKIITDTASTSEFAQAMGATRALIAPAAPELRVRSQIGGWAPGVSIGFAIYAGMFVAAGAWRSDEVNDALASGKAVPLASALQSFNVAVNTATSAVQVAEARADQPSARFVTPQRVAVTASLDSAGALPMVAAASEVAPAAPAPIAAPASIRLYAVDDAIVPAAMTAPAKIIAVAPMAVVQLNPLAAPASLDMRGSEPF